jgi:hypothetical protein
MRSLLEAWRETLRGDLRAFADRGREPEFEVDGNTLRAAWQVRGEERDALFSLMDGDHFRWVSDTSGYEPYPAFLTSPLMANFRGLASAYTATIERQTDFVASEALFADGLESRQTLMTPQALTEIAEGAPGRADGLTRLFFLKGDAGAGKTTLLREATARQAQRYLDGESDFLFLYVPAQGRELSNLRDAFSGELDELRAVFTRDAVAPLARFGVLVPVVDGFDELLGTAGYSGAFSSLQTLLSELEGSGTLVVSARSAFYDVEFLGRASGRRSEADMTITTIELAPWSDEQLKTYLLQDRSGEEARLIERELDRVDEGDRELLKRPFFASQFGSFAEHRSADDDSVDLLEHLITAYIEREAEKIVNANGDPVLPVVGHRHLFELAVGEMWESESRQLSLDDLVAIAELVAEEFGLDADQAAQLKTKVTSYAGFRPRGGDHPSRARFAFEHEVYFDYFVGCAIRRFIADERLDELVSFLDRGVVPETVADFAMSGEGAGSMDERLMRCSSGVAYENRRRNLGGLALAYARRRGPLCDVVLRGLSFIDVRSGRARFRRVSFDACQFLSCDMQEVDFEDCEAASSTFDAVTLSEASRLGVRGLVPGGNVRSVRVEPSGEIYAPAGIRMLLDRLGAPAEERPETEPEYSPRALAMIKLLERVARAYTRTNIIYEADTRLHAVFGDPHWHDLRRLLVEHDVISHEMREAQGANVPACRLRVNVDELLVGQQGKDAPVSATAGLWGALREMA